MLTRSFVWLGKKFGVVVLWGSYADAREEKAGDGAEIRKDMVSKSPTIEARGYIHRWLTLHLQSPRGIVGPGTISSCCGENGRAMWDTLKAAAAAMAGDFRGLSGEILLYNLAPIFRYTSKRIWVSAVAICRLLIQVPINLQVGSSKLRKQGPRER